MKEVIERSIWETSLPAVSLYRADLEELSGMLSSKYGVGNARYDTIDEIEAEHGKMIQSIRFLKDAESAVRVEVLVRKNFVFVNSYRDEKTYLKAVEFLSRRTRHFARVWFYVVTSLCIADSVFIVLYSLLAINTITTRLIAIANIAICVSLCLLIWLLYRMSRTSKICLLYRHQQKETGFLKRNQDRLIFGVGAAAITLFLDRGLPLLLEYLKKK